MQPAFVSVTYGAGGTTREKTLEWSRTIQERYGLTVMAHFTCVGASRSEVQEQVRQIVDAGIRNIMALRGDPPRGEELFRPAADGFAHADELIGYIRDTGYDLCIGAAAYPEVHPEAESSESDLSNLKRKVEAGADFLVTQLFFNNQAYFDFLRRCRDAGISVPVLPGLMPITQLKQIERFTQMAGTDIPDSLRQELEATGDDRDRLLAASIAYSTAQARELLEGGAPGIHFYTLNQSRATMRILEALR